MIDLKAQALKHLIEKLVSMPGKHPEHMASAAEEMAEGEGPHPEMESEDDEMPHKPGLSITAIELKGKKKAKPF
jgi:hypothetical protein